jgi:hypothetical protein
MSQFYDKASLVVVPSGYKAGTVYAQKPLTTDGQLAFTRTGDTATRVNSAGVIEKVRTNYARQSQSFATAAAWTATNGTLTNNAGTAPDGTNTASKIVATNTDPFCYQSITLTGPVVASCYLKAVGSAIGKSAEIRAGVSLTAFTLSGSWQRVFVTHTASGAHNYGLEVPNPGVIGDEVLLWGFQVEGGDIATPYIPTTTAAVSVGPVSNVPRLDYLGSTCPRLLLEPQRQNLVTFSESFDNAGWTKTNTTITANTAISPDGYQNADRAQLAAGALLFQSGLGSAGSNTLSVYAKATSGTSAKFRFFANGNTLLSSDQTATGEWQRFTFTYTFSAVTAGISVATTGADDVLFYGFQHEIGAYATSYIPTLSASATRGADAASKTGISSLIGQTEGVLFVDFTVDTISAQTNDPVLCYMKDGGVGERYVQLYSTGNLRYLENNGATIATITKTGLSVGRHKCAIAYANNDMVFYVDGVQIGTDTSGTPSGFSTFALQYYNAAYLGQQKVNQALLFKTRLTNAQLAELTTL